MNKVLLASAIFAGISSSAFAADLPVYSAPAEMPVAPAYDWSGAYVGLNGGYSWGDLDTRDVSATNTDPTSFILPPGTFGGPNLSQSFDGLIGGAQVGYNHQIGNIVFGIEADIQASDQDAEDTRLGSAAGPSNHTEAELDWFSTVRGRVGYAFDNILVYGTGGLAVGRAKVGARMESIPPLPAQSASASKHETLTGFTLGAGTEIGIGHTGWSVKAEYLYVNFASERVHLDLDDGLDATSKIDLDMHIVRAGLNYRF
jgi:outer membrane immunogenic protein